MTRWPNLALVLALLATACANSDAAAADSCTDRSDDVTTHQYRDLDATSIDAGADPAAVSLDIHASPTAQNCPAVIWVHGGSWQAGDKQTRSTTVKADHLVASGHVFVSINYRLAAEGNNIRWPDFGSDVAAATAWVIDNAEDLGIDPDRISLMGHSSGAHLVSIVGTNPSLLAGHGRSTDDVACVVSLDSVTHDPTDVPPWEVDIVDLAFPTDEAKVDGSPTLQAEANASAATPDFLIVTRGRRERIESSERLARVLSEGGGHALMVDVSPYDHGEVSTMLGVADEDVVTPVVGEFLASCHDGDLTATR